MLEYWILIGCALAAALIGLGNNAAWKRKYAALLEKAKRMNQTWFDTALRHDQVWSKNAIPWKKRTTSCVSSCELRGRVRHD